MGSIRFLQFLGPKVRAVLGLIDGLFGVHLECGRPGNTFIFNTLILIFIVFACPLIGGGVLLQDTHKIPHVIRIPGH